MRTLNLFETNHKRLVFDKAYVSNPCQTSSLKKSQTNHGKQTVWKGVPEQKNVSHNLTLMLQKHKYLCAHAPDDWKSLQTAAETNL